MAQPITLPRKRSFASCSMQEIESLQHRKYAQKTEKSLKHVGNIFLTFISGKGHSVVPPCVSSLNSLLCEYWPSLRTLKEEEYSASSLLTHRQLLRTYIVQQINVDIISDIRLKQHNNVFENYLKGLKERGKGTVCHYPEIPLEDMQKIISTLTTSNPVELQLLSWWYIQFFFCKRGLENTVDMKKKDICFEVFQNKEVARLGCVKKTKNHQETDEDALSGGRICEIPGHIKCPVKVLKLYISKLHQGNEWLWQKPSTLYLPDGTCWYANLKVGHNAIAQMMKNISKFCSLSKLFTNHSVRVSTCTLLGELGFSDLDVQAVSKHKSVDSLGQYRKTKDSRKIEMATLMANSIGVMNKSNEPVPAICTTSSQGPPILDSPYEHQCEYLNDNVYHQPTINLCEEENMALSTLPDFDVDEFIKLCENETNNRSSSLSKNAMTSCSSKNSDQVLQKSDKSITISNCQHFTIHM